MTLRMETGTANGQVDFLSKLGAYIQNIATEWTFRTSQAATGDTANTVLTISMGTSCYFSLKSRVAAGSNDRLFCLPHRGYTAGEFLNQPSSPRNTPNLGAGLVDYTISIPITATFTYWIFSDTNYIYIIAKMSGNYYTTLGFGKLTTFAGGDHGYFVHGSNDSGAFDAWDMCDWDNLSFNSSNGYPTGLANVTGCFGSFSGLNFNFPGCMGAVWTPDGQWRTLDYEWYGLPATGVNSNMRFDGRDTVNGADPNHLGLYPICDTADVNIMSPLMPKIWVAPHPTLTGKLYHYAQTPAAFAINTRNIPPESEIVVGDDHYLVFPSSKTRNVVSRFGQYAGVAVLKPVS